MHTRREQIASVASPSPATRSRIASANRTEGRARTEPLDLFSPRRSLAIHRDHERQRERRGQALDDHREGHDREGDDQNVLTLRNVRGQG